MTKDVEEKLLDDQAERPAEGYSPSPPGPGSATPDGYDQRLKEWCKKRGLHHHGVTDDETFLDLDYEEEDAISLNEHFDDLHVELSDGYGWRARYLITDLRAHCAKHGKIKTWSDFEKLATVPHQDVE